MFFFVRTKNLNWKILSKTIVTFKKDGMGLRMKVMGGHWKILLLGGIHKRQLYGGNWLKRGLGQFTSLRGGLPKKRGVGVEEGWYPNAPYDPVPEHGINMLKSLTSGGYLYEKHVDIFMKNHNKIFWKTILKMHILISIYSDF